jgi:chitin-binding protein
MASPVSRAVACGPEGGAQAASAACRAAVEASAAGAFTQWDNIRVAGVAGRDRQMIPDGRLCSGGIDRFKGLDLPRTDWPATRLGSGAGVTFRYRTTIPHKGSFRLYLTRDGYDPSKPLRWADLDSRPFLSVTDPAISGGAYVIKGRLAQRKPGRHVVFTIWQNSNTPDTYYSCSDVIFGATGSGARSPSAAASRPAAGSPAVSAPAVPDTSEAAGLDAAAGLGDNVRPVAADGGPELSSWLTAGGATALGAVLLASVLLVWRQRRPRSTPPETD